VSTPQVATSARDEVRKVAPKLIELSEIGEVITHMAFYAGWPTAMTAGRIARKVFDGAKS